MVAVTAPRASYRRLQVVRAPLGLTGFAFAFEHLEIAAYEQLSRVAERAGDHETVELAMSILAEERAMAGRLAEQWDTAVDSALEDQGVRP